MFVVPPDFLLISHLGGLTQQGLMVVIEAMKHNVSLTTLDIPGNSKKRVDKPILQAIIDMVSVNQVECRSALLLLNATGATSTHL